MKRALVIVVPIALLVLINACNLSNGTLPQYSPEQWTAIVQTQQVMQQPETDRIKNWMNAAPLDYDGFASLEDALVGKYQVTSVSYPNEYYLQMNMDCQCAYNSNCCDPERMFVLALERMKASQGQVATQVRSTVQFMNLICTDRSMPFALMSAPWDKIKDFLLGKITGAELAPWVSKRSMP